jgi:hypothetical protein
MKSNVVRTVIIIIFVCFGVIALHLLFGESETPVLEGATTRIAAIALSFGAALFIVAAVFGLLRQTRGAPAGRRLRLMAHLACAAVVRVLPSRLTVAVLTGGFLAFLGVLLAGLAATVVIVRQIPPEFPNPTEAYQGFGDFVRALFFLGIGAVLSFATALIAGVSLGMYIAIRHGRDAPGRLGSH